MTDKTPLVLLPGLLCDARLWAHQRQHLTDIADIRVADLTKAESMRELASGVLKTAPEQFALAGLSMGGYVAMEIMRQAPHRVTRLALLDTSARPDTDEQRTRRRGLIELAEKGKFKGVTPRLLPLLIHEGRMDDTALTDTVLAMAEHVGKDAFLRQQKAILGRPDSRPDLPDYDLPVLVLAGREDALTPLDAAEEMAGLIPGSQLTVLEDCGHLSTLERPGETTAAMRQWLERE